MIQSRPLCAVEGNCGYKSFGSGKRTGSAFANVVLIRTQNRCNCTPGTFSTSNQSLIYAAVHSCTCCVAADAWQAQHVQQLSHMVYHV